MPLEKLLKSKAAWLPSASEEHPIVLASRVRFARNLSGARFPSGASAQARLDILQRVFDAVREAGVLDKPAFLSFEELQPAELGLLRERHLISREAAAQPQGRGLALASGETLSVLVNCEDHLRLQVIGPGYCLNSAHAEADKLDTLLGRRLAFAFQPRWGYLTASPADAGTGLRASALAHLGALSLLGRMTPVLEDAASQGLLVRGLSGKGGLVYGDLFQFSTGAALGKSETEYVAGLSRFLKGLFDLELRAQRELQTPAHRARLEDAAFRAWGVLMNAKRLSYEELMKHLSLLRLASRLGLAPAFDAAALLDLAVSAQPAHLQYSEKRGITEAEEPALRAEFVRARLLPKGTRPKGQK